METSLEIWKMENHETTEHECDGCGEDIPEGELYLYGIESCCGGGCARILCGNCLKKAHVALFAGVTGKVKSK